MQKEVDDLYAAISKDIFCSIELFEWRVRRINTLNQKIKQYSADTGRT